MVVVVVVLAFVVVVVVVLVVVHVPTGALHRPVVVALDAAAELQAEPPEAQLLVGEGRERGEIRLRRQRLEARGLEVANLRPRAEPPGQALRLALLHVGAHNVGPVVEPRADVLHAVLDLQLVVVPVDDVQADAHLVDDGVVQVAHAYIEPPDAAPRVEVDLDFLLIAVVVLNAVVVLVFLVVAVELVGERDPVTAVLRRHAAAGEEPVAEVADAGAGVGQLGRGVRDRALGRVVVAGAPRAAAGPEQQVVLRMLQAGVGARLFVRATRVGAQLRPCALEQRVAVALVRRDDVDEAADGVRAVQQRRRPAHDLDAFGGVRIDRDAVVAGLARQVARADPVLQDQDAVAVEAADDRPSRTRAEAPAGNAGLPLQRVTQAPVNIGDEVERVERLDGIERFERRLRAARRRGDGHVLVHGRQAQLEVHGRRTAGRQRDHLPARGQVLALGEHLVAARRHIHDLERPVLGGQTELSRAHDEHDRAVDRPSVVRQCYRPAHRAVVLRLHRRRQRGERRKHDRDDGRKRTASEMSIHWPSSPACATAGAPSFRGAIDTALAAHRAQTELQPRRARRANGDRQTNETLEKAAGKLRGRCAGGELRGVVRGDPQRRDHRDAGL